MHEIDIGLVFSTSGPYGALGRNALAGARMAIDELAEEGALRINARHVDPAGRPDLYQSMTADLLAEGGIRHLVGGITSWSRKDMIPVLERHRALLWYPCPYEGFEANDHVVYLGGCPNQHLLPLLERMIAAGHRRVFLAGSNYVWGWETLRVARERLSAAGMEIVGERYVPLGERDCSRLIAEIADKGCDLVVNSLIGPTNHGFVQSLAQLKEIPQLISANQTEADLDELGTAANGMLSIAPWFASYVSEANRSFMARAAERHQDGLRVSCFFATSYAAIQLLARGVLSAQSDAPLRVFDAVAGQPQKTVLGPVSIDPVTRHTQLTPRLAVAQDGRFDVIESFDTPVWPDPYLAHARVRADEFSGAECTDRPIARRPNLKVVT